MGSMLTSCSKIRESGRETDGVGVPRTSRSGKGHCYSGV